MRSFDDIYRIAAERHGGPRALEARLASPPVPFEPTPLDAATDDRWLSMFTRCIFQAGFNWKIIDAKWDGFEAAFDGFDVGKCAMMDDDWFDRLVQDTRIVRNGAKIRSVRDNAVLLRELAQEGGSASRVLADWPAQDYAGLLAMLKKRGSRLGGTTAQYALRFMGKESYILSRDVVARLIAEGVIDKPPSSGRAMAAVQAAFNAWAGQSGRSLTDISRVLALSHG